VADKPHPMEEWLKSYPPRGNGKRDEEDASAPGNRVRVRGSGKRGGPAVLDLHGMTREEALKSLRAFLGAGASRGLRKALVIHGRGNRSAQGAVLPAVVRRELENNPLVADIGPAEPENGGAGALWVFLRQRSR